MVDSNKKASLLVDGNWQAQNGEKMATCKNQIKSFSVMLFE